MGGLRASASRARGPTPPDPADEAMVARAHERFAAERKKAGRARRGGAEGALPNLIVIGGLKCGTTSLHHYLNLHPEIGMSRPKELNFFVEELNWGLGADWYRGHFPAGRPSAARRRPTTRTARASRALPSGCARRSGATRASYTWCATRSTACSRTTCTTSAADTRIASSPKRSPIPGSAYVQRGLYAFQLEPYLGGVRGRAHPGRLARGARRGARRDRPPRLRVLRRRARLHLARVRPRVGDGQRQGVRRLSPDGPRRAHAGPPRARPQLRPPARADALAGRADGPRPRFGRGRKA